MNKFFTIFFAKGKGNTINYKSFKLAEKAAFPCDDTNANKPTSSYLLHDGLLYKRVNYMNKLVIPSNIITNTLLKLHLKGIHSCDFEVAEILKTKFYIPGFDQARKAVKTLCTTC